MGERREDGWRREKWKEREGTRGWSERIEREGKVSRGRSDGVRGMLVNEFDGKPECVLTES